MITLIYKNGLRDTIPKDMYTSYTYDGKALVITKNQDIKAIINLDCVSCVTFD